MRIFLICMLSAVHAVQKSQEICEESRQLESTCGHYCFKAVRPILDHTRILQSKVDGIEDRGISNTLGKLDNIKRVLHSLTDIIDNRFSAIERKIDQQFRRVQEELQPIKRELSALQQKLENFQKSEGKVDALEKSTQQKIENLREVIEIIDKRPFEKIGTKYYFIENNQRLNWFAAKKRCQQLGGHLISLQNEDELKAVSAKLTEPNYWLDIDDNNFEGEYISSTSGKRAKFLKWNKGEPNNIVQEDCILILSVNSYYLMNDERCSAEHNYICEKE